MKQKASRSQDALNDQQQLFVLEYLVDFNATKAAIRAGYSKRSAGSIGHELLKKPEIQSAVSEAVKERTERTQIDADWVLRRLAADLTADIADLFDDKGVMRPVEEWPMAFRTGLVAGLETEEIIETPAEDQLDPQAQGGALKRRRKSQAQPTVAVRVRKIKFSDRKSRIELAGKHVDVQAFKERREHSVDSPLQKLMQQIGGQSIRPVSEAQK